MIKTSALSPFKLVGPQYPFSTEEPFLSNRKARAERIFRSIAPNANSGGGIESKTRIEQLIENLTDRKDAYGRYYAAEALGEIGPNAKEAIPHLIIALEDENVVVKSSTAWALGKIGPGAKEAIPHLIIALKDKNYYVRKCAVDALGNIGPGAKEAVPALISALKDEIACVRESAGQALGKIGKDAVPELLNALQKALLTKTGI